MENLLNAMKTNEFPEGTKIKMSTFNGKKVVEFIPRFWRIKKLINKIKKCY